MKGHPDLAGVYKVADELVAGLDLTPAEILKLYALIAQALLDEREACAKVAEAKALNTARHDYDPEVTAVAGEIAEEIRAR